ncbi:MAG TPA: DUF3293 domain-containing protein [Castellaniella sp.]|nr:DUF3293 domain-containing protein [Castellaniella sp.]
MDPLDRAYRDAVYRIDTDPPLTVRIGQASPGIAALHHAHQCTESLFISACNPRSRRLRPAGNARRTRALRRALERLGRAWLPARGMDPDGQWPDEPGFWIAAMPLDEGLRLARRFGQNAIVRWPGDTVGQLAWVPAADPGGARRRRARG